MCKATQSVEICKELAQLGVVSPILGILRNFLRINVSTRQLPSLLNVLGIIQNLTHADESIAIEFLDESKDKKLITEVLEREIKKIMHFFQQNEHRLEDDSDSIDVIMLKNEQFASLVRTYAKFAHYFTSTALRVCLESFGKVLLGFTEINEIDPLVLTAICDFAYEILTSKSGSSNPFVVQTVLNNLGQLVNLIRALDMNSPTDRYLNICVKANMYNRGVIINGAPVPFENLTSPIMHKMIISIIRLFGHASKYGSEKGGPIEKALFHCAEMLNENGRETLLFDILQVPDDNVKLEAVRCLNNIDVSQIESDELSAFTRLLHSYKNIGAGKTEEVLSLVFLVMAKLLKDTGTAAREFLHNHVKGVVIDGLDL